MSDIKRLTQKILDFRNERDWGQFHKPKDVALSLMLEAAEVLELFQWKSDEEVKKFAAEHKEAFRDELADVLYWVLLLAHDLDIDIVDAMEQKIKKNALKYPVEKARGKSTKYTDL